MVVLGRGAGPMSEVPQEVLGQELRSLLEKYVMIFEPGSTIVGQTIKTPDVSGHVWGHVPRMNRRCNLS